MTALYISLGALGFLAIALFLGAYITYRIAFYRNPEKDIADPYSCIDQGGYGKFQHITRPLIDNVLSLPYEDIYVTSHDGLRLRGRYYAVKEGAPLVIQFHGYRSTPMKDFSGAGVMSLEFGYNFIMIDQRAHGNSQGRTISFGYYEHLDALRWIDYATERFGKDVKIVLQGISMGAATVLLASGENLPENVVGVMADCPYSSTKGILSKVIREDMKLPVSLAYPLLRFGARLYGKFDPNETDVVAAVKKSRIPILLIHGEADKLCPHYMSEEIAATGKCEFHSFPDAAHGISYILDTERYKSISKEFLERAFSTNPTTDNA